MTHWIAVKTKGMRERYAADNVHRQGHKTYLPVCEARRRSPGKLSYVLHTPLFPGYLFVETDGPWRFLLGTYGVTSIVMAGNEPAIMPAQAIEHLRSREIDGLITLPKLAKGQLVRVNGGNFKDHIGIYQGQTSRERVAVLLDILGGRRVVNIDKGTIEAA